MKKLILLFVLAFAMIAGPVFACECTCGCPTNNMGLNLFQPPTDKDINPCPNVCGRVPGSLKYDGESLSVVCPCTGEGFDCAPPRGQKLIPWFLCDCDAFSELLNNEKLGVVIEIITPGAKFYSNASIGTPSIGIYGFESEEDFCDGTESNYVNLPYHYDDGVRRTILVSNASRNLFQHEQLYLGICIPPIEIDQAVVPINTPVKIRISIYRDKYICGYECGAELCPVECVVAYLGCFQCCQQLPYLPCDPYWAGVVLTNLDAANESMVIMAFVNAEGRQIKIIDLAPGEVKTFTPASIGVTLNGPTWAVLKATTPVTSCVFGGDASGVFALPSEACGCK